MTYRLIVSCLNAAALKTLDQIARVIMVPMLSSSLVLGCNSVNSSEMVPDKKSTVKTIHPSWDTDQDGINDCEKDGSCDHTTDYSLPRQREQVQVGHTKPTFDCSADALSSAEKLICSDSELAEYDQAMGAVFAKALASIDDEQNKKTFKAIQRGWIKGRNECWKAADLRDCTIESYRHRQSEIEARYGLVPSSIRVKYACEGDLRNEFIVTYYASLVPSAMMERGDKSELLLRQTYQQSVQEQYSRSQSQQLSGDENQPEPMEGVFYTAGDYSIREYNGLVTIKWGYGTEPLQCQVK